MHFHIGKTPCYQIEPLFCWLARRHEVQDKASEISKLFFNGKKPFCLVVGGNWNLVSEFFLVKLLRQEVRNKAKFEQVRGKPREMIVALYRRLKTFPCVNGRNFTRLPKMSASLSNAAGKVRLVLTTENAVEMSHIFWRLKMPCEWKWQSHCRGDQIHKYTRKSVIAEEN